jgi:hypothetical protein
MPIIKITTIIKAKRQLVFDLSRSIDLHQISTADTNEKAVAEVTSGLIDMGGMGDMESKAFWGVSKIDFQDNSF